jgi:hypothetical protein
VQQIVLVDDSVAMLDEIGQEVENLRLQLQELTATPQLASPDIEHVFAKGVPHCPPP